MDIPELFQGSNGRLGNNILVNLVSKELLSLWSSSKKSPIHKDRSPQLTSRIPSSSYSQQTVISLCFLWLCMGASVVFPSFSISSILWLLSQSSSSEYGISPCLFGSELSTSAVGELFIRVILFHSIKFLSFNQKTKKHSHVSHSLSLLPSSPTVCVLQIYL